MPQGVAVGDARRGSASAPDVYLVAAGSYLPGDPVDNALLDHLFPTLGVKAMMQYFGVEQRHFVVDPATGERLEPGLGALTMATRAAEQAMAQARITPAQVDTLITITITPDVVLPPFSLLLQRRLGLPRVQTYDLRGGCAASVQALVCAQTLLATGRAHTALVVGVECTSPACYGPMVEARKMARAVTREQKLNGLLFGDGAGAVVLQEPDVIAARGCDAFRLAYGNACSQFAQHSAGFSISRPETAGQVHLQHSHRSIRNMLPQVLGAALADLQDATGHALADYVKVIMPQVNQSMLKVGAPTFNPESTRPFYIGHQIGSVPGGAIFIAIDKALRGHHIHPGQGPVAILGIETTSWIYAVAELH
jgi:3-oxoacyl-[acyl-carrier-protein] synthase-3